MAEGRLNPILLSREQDEDFSDLIASGKNFDTVVLTMPGYLQDLPSDDENESEKARPSDDQALRSTQPFWKLTDKLYHEENQSGYIDDEVSQENEGYSLQRTQLYTNGSIGFVPFWSKNVSDGITKENTYDIEIWRLFETLECSGVRQFTMDIDLGRGKNVLFGGSDNLAEGASYSIGTRLMQKKDDQRLVAVKRIKGSLMKSRLKTGGKVAASRIRTIQRDIEIMTRPQYRKTRGHPYVLSCLGYGWDTVNSDPSVFVVVPWAQHGTLRQFLTKANISYPTKNEIFKQICLGLRSLHRKDIAHGDIKLENVLVFNRPHLETKEGIKVYEASRKKFPQAPPISENVTIKVADFGCSITTSGDRYTGTAAYNAPEVRNGSVNTKTNNSTVSRFLKCDIFSCGLLFLEMLLDGVSIAANSQVQDLRLDERGELEILNYAIELVLQLVNNRTWISRGQAIARDLYCNMFNATLRYNPDDRYTLDYLLNEMETATFRASFASDDDETLRSILGDGDKNSLIISDPVHQLTQLQNSEKVISEPSFNAELRNMPRQMLSQLFSALYETSMSEQGEAAATAADRVIASCLERRFTKVTEVEEFLCILKNYVGYSRSHHAPYLYYRLLHSLDRPIPKISVEDAQQQAILDLEFRLLSLSLPQGEYGYERMIAYRQMRRSMVKESIPEELVIAQNQIGVAREEVVDCIWQDPATQHLLQSPSASIWLLRTNQVSILKELISQDPTWQNPNVVHELLIEACKMGYLEAVECLIRTTNFDSTRIDSTKDRNPFHFLNMFERSHVGMAVSLFANANYDINAIVSKDEAIQFWFLPERMFWGSPLSVAIQHNREDVVSVLIDGGASITGLDNDNRSAINVAAQCNRPELMKSLLQRTDREQDTAISPLRTLTLGLPYSEELAHGQQKRQAIAKTIAILVENGFDVNEELEQMPSIGYNAELTVFERALRDGDFTIDFALLDELLDHGFNRRLEPASLPQHLKHHHERIQVKLIDYLINRKLVSASSGVSALRSFICTLIHEGMAGVLRVSLTELPKCANLIKEPIHSHISVTPLHLAVVLNADADMMNVLLDFGASPDGDIPNPSPWTLKLSFKTVFENVVFDGRLEVVDLLLDRGAALSAELLASLTYNRHLRVQGKHILHHLLRRSETEPECFRHPTVAQLLAQDMSGEVVYEVLLKAAIAAFNLDAILILLSFGFQVPGHIYEELLNKFMFNVLIASCAEEKTKKKYLKNCGFESTHQYLVAVWKLLVHWSLQRQGLENELGFSYLHWASMMFSPELVRELIAGGADVFAESNLGHVPLDIAFLAFKTNEDDLLEAYSTLYRVHLQNEFYSAEISQSGSNLDLDSEKLQNVRKNSTFGLAEFQIRQILTAQILNQSMLSECAKDLSRTPTHSDSPKREIAQHFDQCWANFTVLDEEHEGALYAQAWLQLVET